MTAMLMRGNGMTDVSHLQKRPVGVAGGDNPPIGIILSRNKDELLVEYATYQMSSQLFVQKYQLYRPDREALRRELELSLREVEQ